MSQQDAAPVACCTNPQCAQRQKLVTTALVPQLKEARDQIVSLARELEQVKAERDALRVDQETQDSVTEIAHQTMAMDKDMDTEMEGELEYGVDQKLRWEWIGDSTQHIPTSESIGEQLVFYHAMAKKALGQARYHAGQHRYWLDRFEMTDDELQELKAGKAKDLEDATVQSQLNQSQGEVGQLPSELERLEQFIVKTADWQNSLVRGINRSVDGYGEKIAMLETELETLKVVTEISEDQEHFAKIKEVLNGVRSIDTKLRFQIGQYALSRDSMVKSYQVTHLVSAAGTKAREDEAKREAIREAKQRERHLALDKPQHVSVAKVESRRHQKLAMANLESRKPQQLATAKEESPKTQHLPIADLQSRTPQPTRRGVNMAHRLAAEVVDASTPTPAPEVPLPAAPMVSLPKQGRVQTQSSGPAPPLPKGIRQVGQKAVPTTQATIRVSKQDALNLSEPIEAASVPDARKEYDNAMQSIREKLSALRVEPKETQHGPDGSLGSSAFGRPDSTLGVVMGDVQDVGPASESNEPMTTACMPWCCAGMRCGICDTTTPEARTKACVKWDCKPEARCRFCTEWTERTIGRVIGWYPFIERFVEYSEEGSGGGDSEDESDSANISQASSSAKEVTTNIALETNVLDLPRRTAPPLQSDAYENDSDPFDRDVESLSSDPPSPIVRNDEVIPWAPRGPNIHQLQEQEDKRRASRAGRGKQNRNTNPSRRGGRPTQGLGPKASGQKAPTTGPPAEIKGLLDAKKRRSQDPKETLHLGPKTGRMGNFSYTRNSSGAGTSSSKTKTEPKPQPDENGFTPIGKRGGVAK